MVNEPDAGAPAVTFDAEDFDLAGGLTFVLDVLLSDVHAGETIEMTSTNPGLVHELPAWARGTGNELVASEPDGARRSIASAGANGPH